jgi:hypothetical protein
MELYQTQKLLQTVNRVKEHNAEWEKKMAAMYPAED